MFYMIRSLRPWRGEELPLWCGTYQRTFSKTQNYDCKTLAHAKVKVAGMCKYPVLAGAQRCSLAACVEHLSQTSFI